MMVNSMVFLQSYGFSGGNFGNILSNLEQLGFFDYVLPFLIIFALVFGILSRIKLFGDNKSISAVIALSVGLMALQFGLVSSFFAELFPRFGIGLSIILVLLILTGLFTDPDEDWSRYALLGVGLIIAVVILIQSSGITGFYSGFWWQNNWPGILTMLILGVLVIAVIAGSKSSSSKTPGVVMAPYFRGLKGP